MLLPLVLPGGDWASAGLGLLLAGGYYIIYGSCAAASVPPQKLYVRAFGRRAGKLAALASTGFFLLLSGFLAGKSAAFFPQTARTAWAGLGVLTLAALCAHKGTAAALRCGSILLLPLAAAFAAVLLCAVPGIDPQRLRAAPTPRQTLNAALTLLLPTAGLYLLPAVRQDGTRPLRWALALAPAAPLTALVLAGTLPPSRTGGADAFYTLARSVTVFGVMLRLEALISAALTAGAFLGCALLFCAASQVLEDCLPVSAAARSVGSWIFSAAALLTTAVSRDTILLLAGIFCGLFPLTAQGLVCLKKAEKKRDFFRKKD